MPLFGAPGERIGYNVYSHPNGAPPLLLIHGFTASKASFEVNLDGLRKRFTVITVELLGHGDSEAPATAEAYRPERAAQRILQLIEHLGYQRVLLCGHSLGGALALRIALFAPEWLAGLIVINSSSAAGTPEWREAARPRMVEMAARVRAEGTAFMKGTRLYPAHSKRLDPRSRELLTRDFDRLQPEGLAGTAESLVVDVNAYEQHPSLMVPMLLVVGERDADFAPNAAAFLERFPPEMVREVRLPHAGHAANIEQPREFEAAVVDFATDIGYLPAPNATHGNNRMLTALGGSLVVAGLAMLVASVLFTGRGDGNGDRLLAAAPENTRPAATATTLADVAGSRSAGPVNQAAASATPTRGTATVPPAVATSAAGVTAVPTSTPRPAPPTSTPRPQSSATPEPQPTATPTSPPTATPTSPPAATSTPVGTFAAIAGPSSAAVGETIALSDASHPASITRNWQLPSGPRNADYAVPFRSNAPGCYSVSMTAYFADGKVLTTAKSISVGGVSCGN